MPQKHEITKLHKEENLVLLGALESWWQKLSNAMKKGSHNYNSGTLNFNHVRR